MESENNIDLNNLHALKSQIKLLQSQRKDAKSQIEDIEQKAIGLLMNMGVRYVDESGRGQGPYWTLVKAKVDSSFSKERLTTFFNTLLTELKNGAVYTPEQCALMAQAYIKQFQKRKLMLKKLTQCRQKGVEDLREWLDA
jgi:hypothetical protein